VTQPAAGRGTVSIASGGKSLVYSAPNQDFTGTVEFQYTLGDGTGQTATASVVLTVVNFTPRDVGITHQGNVQGVLFQVVQQDGTNNGNGNFTPTYVGNVVKLDDVGPGTYEFAAATLPFFIPNETQKVVFSEFADGDNVSTQLNVGTRDPRFMDLRDFTSRSLRKGLMAAVQPNQQAAWYNGVREWRSFSSVSVTLNQAATQLTIKTTDSSNASRQATISTSDPRVVLRGREGEHRLYRIQAAPSELTFTNVPPATTTNSSTTNGASGEGEGEGGLSSSAPGNTLPPRNVDSAMAAPPVELDAAIDDVAAETVRRLTLSDFRSRR
jgi:hypothetical protein